MDQFRFVIRLGVDLVPKSNNLLVPVSWLKSGLSTRLPKRRSAFIIAQDVSHQLCGDHGLCYASL